MLDIAQQDLFGNQVILEEKPFIRNGVADNWLMDLFGLKQPRSLPAERAIENAKGIQLQMNPNPEDVSRVSQELKRTLSADDEFWPRWTYFANQHGVDR